jgi:hypothetical protein
MSPADRERGVDRAIRETDLPDGEIANEYDVSREYVSRRRALLDRRAAIAAAAELGRAR